MLLSFASVASLFQLITASEVDGGTQTSVKFCLKSTWGFEMPRRKSDFIWKKRCLIAPKTQCCLSAETFCAEKKLIHTPSLPVYMTYESHQSLISEPCFDRTLLRRGTEPIRIQSRRTSNRVPVLPHVTVGVLGYFSIRRVTGRVARKAQSKPSQIPLYWCFESFPQRWYIPSLFGLHVIENAMVWSHNRSKFELKAASLCANHCFLQQRDGITTCILPWWLARKDLASWRWSERDDYCQNDLTTRLLQISQYFKLSCRKDPKLHVHWPDVMT